MATSELTPQTHSITGDHLQTTDRSSDSHAAAAATAADLMHRDVYSPGTAGATPLGNAGDRHAAAPVQFMEIHDGDVTAASGGRPTTGGGGGSDKPIAAPEAAGSAAVAAVPSSDTRGGTPTTGSGGGVDGPTAAPEVIARPAAADVPLPELPEGAATTGGDRGAATTPQAPESAQASATAADIHRQLMEAAPQFGSAHSSADQEAALQRYRTIIGSADQNYDGVQGAASREAERLDPGLAGATRDVSGAMAHVAQETDKLTPEQFATAQTQFGQWAEGNDKERQGAEQFLRDHGCGALADAMAAVDKARQDHGAVFSRGDQIEDQVNGRFQHGVQDALTARLDARSDYELALRYAGKPAEADAVAAQTQQIHDQVRHVTPVRTGNN